METKRCVCGKVITSQFDLCNKCQAEYGLDRSKWDDWLIFMVADLKRERRQQAIIDEREIPFSEVGIH